MNHIQSLPRLAIVFTTLLSLGWSHSLASEAYDRATADNPDYGNKNVWPTLTGKEAFTKQVWPKGRTLVWAHPGKDGGGVRARNPLDIFDPQNWLIDGKPATEVVVDENTDIVLPDSDTPYLLSFHGPGAEGWGSTYRHVTVGRNATFRDHSSRHFGNLWVKKGGYHFGSHGNNFSGPSHTFIRNDAAPLEKTEEKETLIGQYFVLGKSSPEISLEIIGSASFLDRIPINSGTLIIGQDSRLSPGRNATMIVGEDATLVLMDGANLFKWVNQIGQADLTVFGKLFGGLPDRPLTRPAYIGLSNQNTTGIRFFDKLSPPQNRRTLETRIAPLMIAEGAVVRSYSANPQAVLTLRYGGVDLKQWQLKGDAGYAEWIKGLSPDDLAYLTQQLDAMPKKVVAIFQKDSSVDGLAFHDFHAGGVLMENPEDFTTSWKNLSVENGAPANAQILITKISLADVKDNVKSSGGEYVTGVQVPMGDQIYDLSDAWDVKTLSVPLPPEAQGRRMGVRFQSLAGTWAHIDDVSLTLDGKDWIKNGGFQIPNDPPGNRGRIGFGKASTWVNMGTNTFAVGITVNEEGRFGSTYGADAPFGQTTQAKGEAGKEAVLTFKSKSEAPSRLRAEIFYVQE